jgi:hypothetical protein
VDLDAAAGLEVALSEGGVEVAFVERADRCDDAGLLLLWRAVGGRCHRQTDPVLMPAGGLST